MTSMIRSSKLAALQQHFDATDAARIRAEQDRDAAYVRIGEQGARINELEATLVEERTRRGDSIGVFVGDRMLMTAELLRELASDERAPLVVEVVAVNVGGEGTKSLLMRLAETDVPPSGQQGEGGSDLEEARA